MGKTDSTSNIPPYLIPPTGQWCAGALAFEGAKDSLARRLAPRNIWYTVPIPNEDGTFPLACPSAWRT